ncbi:MAG: putative ABC transport system ATP-binding protein [Candidatus Methanocomedens sp.]|jgi:putative ABC transport system ATP-binding protein|nr:MAG: putative ABC transport system ATP-binding protein [ANME-2 cluster archaeon]
MKEKYSQESPLDGDSIIDVINIRKSYNRGGMEIPILNGIDLTVKTGEFLAIMGPSGSGKSTLMNMIGCLDRPTSGQIILKGQDINIISDNELAHLRGREIGFVFQTFNLIPRLTAYQNVELPTFATKKNGTDVNAKVRDLLERVGLKDRMDYKITELSGGQCQRVAIARALINDPMLILADEPTGNLDSKTTGEIMKILSDLHEQGRTIIMITHDPEIAEFADRIVLVKDGVIENN